MHPCYTEKPILSDAVLLELKRERVKRFLILVTRSLFLHLLVLSR